MHCCLLGGTGFIGGHLLRKLLEQGHTVSLLSRKSADANMSLPPDLPTDRVRWIVGDFRDMSAVANALEGAEQCFHLVSTTLPRSSNDDPIYDISSNVNGTLAMLQTAISLGVKRVIFVSSGGTVYGTPQFLPVSENHPLEPNCSYGIAKLAIEKYLQLFLTLHGLDYRIIRLSNPYGEGQQFNRAQGAVSVFVHRVLTHERIDIWGDGSTVRDYIYVEDAVRGILGVANYSGGERIFNIGSGQGRSLNSILREIEMALRCTADVSYLPGRAFDVPTNVLSIDRARLLIGFNPETDFAEGLARTVEWQRSVLQE